MPDVALTSALASFPLHTSSRAFGTLSGCWKVGAFLVPSRPTASRAELHFHVTGACWLPGSLRRVSLSCLTVPPASLAGPLEHEAPRRPQAEAPSRSRYLPPSLLFVPSFLHPKIRERDTRSRKQHHRRGAADNEDRCFASGEYVNAQAVPVGSGHLCRTSDADTIWLRAALGGRKR